MTAGVSPKPRAEPQAIAESQRGRCLHYYLHTEDEQKIRSLVTFVSSHGYHVSDSQVIAAALRCAQPDDALLRAFREVRSQDLRFGG